MKSARDAASARAAAPPARLPSSPGRGPGRSPRHGQEVDATRFVGVQRTSKYLALAGSDGTTANDDHAMPDPEAFC